ncbi:transposase [Acidovorax sp. JG5]|uniref:IS4/Tn5 family transposase DNA-binding protein n=1 Tax=Acidovorax sp. JG5 TaxID=2822718 RepID=UPI001B33ADE7|nr:transposase [Acidovorax sp. JG5]MBP3982393.1 transposase [Acidovorax sp. JG5]
MRGEFEAGGEIQGDQTWKGNELSGCKFKDARLGKRLTDLMRRMSGKAGASIPLACQDWANTKAAYRFFSNDRVDEQAILAGHFESTRERGAPADPAGHDGILIQARRAREDRLYR